MGLAFFFPDCYNMDKTEDDLRKSNERRNANMLFAPKEKGQGLVEYALILVLVAIVVIAVLMLLGPIIGNVFSTINNSLSKA